MILKNELYVVDGCHPQESAVVYDLSLLSDCAIYRAHFPGEPITPGVCLIQIARELLEDHLQQPLSLKAVKNVKFLAVVSPLQSPRIQCCLDKIQDTGDSVKAVAEVMAGGQPMTHISFTLSKVQ